MGLSLSSAGDAIAEPKSCVIRATQALLSTGGVVINLLFALMHYAGLRVYGLTSIRHSPKAFCSKA